MYSVNVDFLAPRYVLVVNGTTLKADVTQFVESVVYEEGEDVAAKIELEISNPDFMFNEWKIFAEGNEIDLWIGYAGKPLHFMNRGIIVKPNAGFPRSGMPKFSVVAHGGEIKFFDAPKNGKTYSKKKDSEIVEELFKDAGLAPFVFETKGTKTRTIKKGVTKWEFLQRLAKINGFEITVRFDPTLKSYLGYFGPPETEDDQVDFFTFVYGTGEDDNLLLEFFPDFSLPSQETKIEVTYTDPQTRKTHRLVVETEAKSAEPTKYVGGQDEKLKKPVKNGPSVKLTVFGQTEEIIADRTFSSPADAKRFVAAWFARREREFVFARGASLGVPSLRRRQIHAFNIPSERLTGEWILTSVRHTLGRGAPYETEFTATKKVLDSKIGSVGNSGGVDAEESDL